MANDIRNSLTHYDPFDQRFAVSVLSILESRPLGVTDWRPSGTVFIPGKGKEKGREIASVPTEPRDLHRMCDTYVLPDFGGNVSREQLNEISSCVRYRARALDLGTRSEVEGLRWFDTAPDASEAYLLKRVFASESRSPYAKL